MSLRIESLQAPQLSIDARGGTGAPGFVGLDGGNGENPVVADALLAAVQRLKAAGHTVTTVDLPDDFASLGR